MLGNAYKIVWIAFMIGTVASAGLLLYTSHLYFGVSRAIRLINISVKGFFFGFSDEIAWTETNVTIENPSEYSFNVELLQQKLYLNSLDSNDYIFTAYLSNPVILRPFSNLNATFKIVVPDYKMPLVAGASNRNWLTVFYVSVKSRISDTLTLDFFKQLS
jgi:hypothetical protein